MRQKFQRSAVLESDRSSQPNENSMSMPLRTAVGIFAIISSSCKGCGGSEGTPACSERDKYAKDARGLLFTGNDQFLMKSDMSCEGRVSACIAGARLLHPCFP